MNLLAICAINLGVVMCIIGYVIDSTLQKILAELRHVNNTEDCPHCKIPPRNSTV
jgi:hypothetical protein